MRSEGKRLSGARPPVGGAPPPLRKEDVSKNEGLRGPVVRGGVGAVPSVWED